MSSLPKCYFNYDTLIAKVGNIYDGYEELNCIQVPVFDTVETQRESLGGGWYGNKIKITRAHKRFFIIMKDNKPFGVLLEPYHQVHNIKTDIHPITTKFYYKQINEFIKTL